MKYLFEKLEDIDSLEERVKRNIYYKLLDSSIREEDGLEGLSRLIEENEPRITNCSLSIKNKEMIIKGIIDNEERILEL